MVFKVNREKPISINVEVDGKTSTIEFYPTDLTTRQKFYEAYENGKLQVDKFSTDVTRQYSSGDLMELDYSDETITFTKIKTSQKNKTYEMGTDDGYTLVINNQ